jgi:dolichol kinase
MYDMWIPDLSYWELASGSVFFQFSLYIAVRLAHRGFTLGELGLVVFGATALYMELVNLTVARVRIGSGYFFTC